MNLYAQTNERLANHPLFRTKDVDEARSCVAEKFCDHKLKAYGRNAVVDVRHNHAAGFDVSVNYLQYGGNVSIDPGHLGSFYLIQIPLSGGAIIKHCGVEILANNCTATVLNPDRATRMFWRHDCRKLLLQIDKTHLEKVARALIGRDIPGPIRFHPRLDLQSKNGIFLLKSMLSCALAAETGQIFDGRHVLRDRRIEHDLALALLSHHHSNLTHIIENAKDHILSRDVKRAVEFIHAHYAEQLTMSELAQAAGVSIRTLQKGFQREYSQSPMTYLKNIRLDMSHYLLAQRRDDNTVTDVAYSSGFSHLGRFSADYKARFNCSPRNTDAWLCC
jgi:AraC-like DNA-binding protein|tara:strand:+ start:2113 stop:3111 length:999 start_codon:yes stop_codon:yes gene_type:complete